MDQLPNCPTCASEYTYENGTNLACPDCGHEWIATSTTSNPDPNPDPSDNAIRDANGNELQNGDTVQLTKDLKVKGTATTLKIGTKVKNIRLCDGDHNIDCRIEGMGATKLKSEFVKKI